MIDFASYKTIHLENQVSKGIAQNQDNESTRTVHFWRMNIDETLSGSSIYLFLPMISGFSFRNKAWDG
jgi:hypothetical protein